MNSIPRRIHHFRHPTSMGIKFYCANGHKMHVKEFLAGKKGLCPKCGVRVEIPTASMSGTPPNALELEKQIAAANEPLPNAQLPNANSKKSLQSKMEPVFGMPADDSAPEAILTETVGDEIGPASNSVLPSALGQVDDSSAAIIDNEMNMPAAAADPLQIPPEENWYVHLPTGKQLGPIASDTLREWLDQARIGVDALVWRNGWGQWQVIRDAFSQTQSPAASAEPVISARPDFPDGDRMAPSGLPNPQFGDWPHRRKSRFSATASLCLLGMVVLLFVLLLFVFFNRKSVSEKPVGGESFRRIDLTSDRTFGKRFPSYKEKIALWTSSNSKQPANASSLGLRGLLAPSVGQSIADLS